MSKYIFKVNSNIWNEHVKDIFNQLMGKLEHGTLAQRRILLYRMLVKVLCVTKASVSGVIFSTSGITHTSTRLQLFAVSVSFSFYPTPHCVVFLR